MGDSMSTAYGEAREKTPEYARRARPAKGVSYKLVEGALSCKGPWWQLVRQTWHATPMYDCHSWLVLSVNTLPAEVLVMLYETSFAYKSILRAWQ